MRGVSFVDENWVGVDQLLKKKQPIEITQKDDEKNGIKKNRMMVDFGV